jgi:protein ImuB
MDKRYVSIWFRHLKTDWFTLRQPHRKDLPFVLRTPSHGRMIITAVNAAAEARGISNGMVLADARAIFPDLQVEDDKPDLVDPLLTHLAEWCIRFTPIVGADPPDGLLLDVTGCSHLWGGDPSYLNDMVRKLNARGYYVQAAMADTIGLAWGIARFRKEPLAVTSDKHLEVLMRLPPEALRLETETVDRLRRLGLHQIGQFANMPRPALRRRFGPQLLQRLDMALGQEMEVIEPVQPVEPYLQRLPCLEPIITATGIEVALKELLTALCFRLLQEQKGLRKAVFKGYRADGKTEAIEIETSRPSHHVSHLFKLFEIKIASIEPALGIELFTLEAPTVEDNLPKQEKMSVEPGGLEDVRLSELIDRLASRLGPQAIRRYLPDEHYWPERSMKVISSLSEKPTTAWSKDRIRPLRLLQKPEPIDVTAPIPDYPPMLFRHRGKVHTIIKADGPERIEQEWWLQQGQHRDYYRVEDEDGYRYWLFRLGHYDDETFQWFIHGFFA